MRRGERLGSGVLGPVEGVGTENTHHYSCGIVCAAGAMYWPAVNSVVGAGGPLLGSALTVQEIEEVIPVNKLSWVLLEGVSVGR